jgi:hypothetical protein
VLLSPQQQKPQQVAFAQRRTVFDQRANTITLPNNNSSSCRIGGSSSSSNSADQNPVLRLVLVPALSAPTVLLSEPHAAATAAVPSCCTPQPIECGSAALAAGVSGCPASTAPGAAAAPAQAAAAMTAADATAATAPCRMRAGSWNAGPHVSILAAAPAAASAASDAAASRGKQAEAAPGAMDAHCVPAAGACAAAAGASAAAAAGAAKGSVKSLLSPVRSPLSLRRLRSNLVPAARGRCHSIDLVLGSGEHAAVAAKTAAAAAAAPAAVSCISHTAKPIAGTSPSRVAETATASLVTSSRGALRPAVPSVLLPRAPCDVPSMLQPMPLLQQSPNKACRVMKGVCRKVRRGCLGWIATPTDCRGVEFR